LYLKSPHDPGEVVIDKTALVSESEIVYAAVVFFHCTGRLNKTLLQKARLG
jgi:hypothetical protein